MVVSTVYQVADDNVAVNDVAVYKRESDDK